jgi:ATP-dependent helicase/nuclease subunit B
MLVGSRVIVTGYGRAALDTLRHVVAEAKRDDPMAPVTLLVPNNIAGIVARRHLAHGLIDDCPGIGGLYLATLPRLAEQIAAPHLAPRRPATRPIVAAAWRQALTERPGVFEDVAEHPATVRALTTAHAELRDLSAAALDRIRSTTSITPDLVRLHSQVTEALEHDWYDVTTLLATATQIVTGQPRILAERGTIVLYLPQDLTQAEIQFASALAAGAGLTVIAGFTGVRRADAAVRRTLQRLQLEEPEHTTSAPTATHVITASDSDDEVRCVVRDVVETLKASKAHRITVLYAAASPYSRLLHEHLAAAQIQVNGTGTRPVRERTVARTLTEVLALKDGDVPRADLFRALANAPTRDFEKQRIPLARWERASRSAGVVRGDDWQQRLTRLEDTESATIDAEQNEDDPRQWVIDRATAMIETAAKLRAFTTELRGQLQQTHESWHDLATWCRDLFHTVVGEGDELLRLPPEEQHAATSIELMLQGLGGLDAFDRQPSLQALREILDLELEASLPRVGTFGEGVFVAPISAAIGLDVDVAYVVGLAEDLYPGRIHEDALLPERARQATAGELPESKERLHARHRQLLAALATGRTRVVASFPRGDLRRSSQRLPSRWLLPSLRELADDHMLPATQWEEREYGVRVHNSRSYAHSLTRSAAIATEQEWRTRAATDGRTIDQTVDNAVAMIRSRASDDFTRFDGNLIGVGGLPDFARQDLPVAPTTLESYAECPHAYFVERLLGVKPLEQPEDIVQVSPADIGTLVHEALDALVKALGEDLPPYSQPWTPRQRARLIEIAEQKARELEERGVTGHPRLWEREKLRIIADLDLMLDDDNRWRAEVGAKVATSEMVFGREGQPPVEIAVPQGRVQMRGSADKVDIDLDGTIHVTDVKTGSTRRFKDISLKDPVVGGTKLQLPVYAHAARARYGDRATPVRAQYWFVRGQDRGKRIELPLTADVEQTYADTLGVIVASIAGGLFPPRAPEQPDFAWVQCPFCNPDGIGHAEQRRRWERKRHDPALADYVRLVEAEVLW